MSSTPIIRPARCEHDLATARELFLEYAAEIGHDLCFQSFQAELENLPGKYAPPAGELLIAWRDEHAVGCVAMRPLESDCCEMKRLYLRTSARGSGLGRRLAQEILACAARAGYRRMRLDTLSTMTAAQALYRSLGFVQCGAYYDNPLAGVVYMECALNRGCA